MEQKWITKGKGQESKHIKLEDSRKLMEVQVKNRGLPLRIWKAMHGPEFPSNSIDTAIIVDY